MHFFVINTNLIGKLFRIIVSDEKRAGVAYDLFERAKSNDETIAELRLKSFGAGVAKETLFSPK